MQEDTGSQIDGEQQADFPGPGNGGPAPVSEGGATTLRLPLSALPNLLSVVRLPLAAGFYVIDSLFWRGVLLSLGALTDALDGWLARQLGRETRLGALLDPIFDRLFVLVALSAFLAGPDLGWTEFLVLIARDLYTAVAFLMSRALRLELQLNARSPGKAVTLLQMVALFVLLLAPDLIGFFTVVVGVAAAIAIADYTVAGVVQLRRRRRV